jgi:hypothetical protein
LAVNDRLSMQDSGDSKDPARLLTLVAVIFMHKVLEEQAEPSPHARDGPGTRS